MSDQSATSRPPISDYALQSIVRCIESMDANLNGDHDRERYAGLVQAIENLLLAGGNKESWRFIALSDLATDCWDYMTPERASRHLFSAAKEGYVPAQYELGCRARRGELYPPRSDPLGESPKLPRWELEDFNRVEARWMGFAAEGGSLDARYTLGMELVTSEDPQAFAEGAHWLKLAVYQTPQENAAFDDDYYGQCKFVLAYLMELGRIDPVPEDAMFGLYESAAKGGSPEAMLAAGHYLEHGIGTKRAITAAIDWYRKAAKSGHDDGYIVAYLLSGYDGDPTDAAEAGYVPAMVKLAEHMLIDCWITSSYMSWEHWWALFEGGIGWLDCASEAGSLKATLRLAEVLEGDSDHQFPEEIREEFLGYAGLERALECYQRAGKLGWEHAATHIERIQKLLDGDDEDAEQSDS